MWTFPKVRESERQKVRLDEAPSHPAFLTFLSKRMGGGEEGCVSGERKSSKPNSHCGVYTMIRVTTIRGEALKMRHSLYVFSQSVLPRKGGAIPLLICDYLSKSPLVCALA